MTINVAPIATTTQQDIVPVSNWFWYKMFEQSGTDIADSSGNGAANLTLGGTLPGNVFDELVWISPNGTDTTCLGTDDAVVKEVMRFDTMTNGQQIITFDYQFDGALLNNEAFFWWGRGAASGWGLFMNGSHQFVMQVSGDTGAADNNPTFGGFSMATANGTDSGVLRNTITLDIQGQGDGTGTVDIYVNGTLAITNQTDLTFAGVGVGGTTDTNGDGLTLMARRTGVATTNFDMNSQASTGRMSSFFAMQRTTINDTLAAAVNKEFFDKQGDLPTILDGM